MSKNETESRNQRLFREAEKQRQMCTAWLIERIVPGQPKWATKAEFRNAAMEELGVSKSCFDQAWHAAIIETGREDWWEPLRRRKRNGDA